MKLINLLICIIGLTIIMSGCSTVQKFTLLSTQDIEIDRLSEYQISSQYVTGDYIAHVIIFFVYTQKGKDIFEKSMKDSIPFLNALIDNALKQVQGAVALVDVVYKSQSIFFFPIYVKSAMIIEGKALVDPKLLDLNNNNDTSYNVLYSNDGIYFSQINIDEEEYKTIVKSKNIKKYLNRS